MTEKEVKALGEETKALLNAEQWNQLNTWCSSTAERVSLDTKAKQIQKFERLHVKQHLAPQLDQDKAVRNFNSRTLVEKEKEALALGLNFAVAPKQIPTFEIIAATEATANQLDKETAQSLRQGVSSILNTTKLPKSNLSRELHKAVKSLREDKNIVILPADKGNATVVLDRVDYEAKMENLLKDSAYKKVTQNPTSRVEAKVSTALRECVRKGHITGKKHLTLAHQFTSPPPPTNLRPAKDTQGRHPLPANRGSHRFPDTPVGKGAGQDPFTTGWQESLSCEELKRLCESDPPNLP